MARQIACEQNYSIDYRKPVFCSSYLQAVTSIRWLLGGLSANEKEGKDALNDDVYYINTNEIQCELYYI